MTGWSHWLEYMIDYIRIDFLTFNVFFYITAVLKWQYPYMDNHLWLRWHWKSHMEICVSQKVGMPTGSNNHYWHHFLLQGITLDEDEIWEVTFPNGFPVSDIIHYSTK